MVKTQDGLIDQGKIQRPIHRHGSLAADSPFDGASVEQVPDYEPSRCKLFMCW